MKVCWLLSRAGLFATPWTVACQASLSMGFSRQEYWSGLPFPSPGALPNPGIKPEFPALQADSLPSEPQGSPSPQKCIIIQTQKSTYYVIPFCICGDDHIVFLFQSVDMVDYIDCQMLIYQMTDEPHLIMAYHCFLNTVEFNLLTFL